MNVRPGAFATDELPPRVERAIRASLEPYATEFGIEEIRIEPGEDHDGDPVVFVEVRHRFLVEPIDVKSVIALDRQLRDRVWDAGERRFVHVRHQYDERQGVAA
jgi:hypothetical protein